MRSAGPGALRAALVDLRIELFAHTHAVAQAVDLNYCDLSCLDIIHRAGQISPSELARRTATHAATVTGIIRRLEERGWIERTAHPEDRRAVLLRLPADRAERLAALYRDADRRLDAVGRCRTGAEQAVVVGYLRDVSGALRDAFEAREDRGGG
ncbi:MAG: MarR family transcriptional regulator [Austwickia sp.]|nr:MAG: MarR family transcriptional regulator [Austwickia sp.]